MVEINEAERKKELNEDNLRDLWDNVKCPNIRIIGVPEEEDKKIRYQTAGILKKYLIKEDVQVTNKHEKMFCITCHQQNAN